MSSSQSPSAQSNTARMASLEAVVRNSRLQARWQFSGSSASSAGSAPSSARTVSSPKARSSRNMPQRIIAAREQVQERAELDAIVLRRGLGSLLRRALLRHGELEVKLQIGDALSVNGAFALLRAQHLAHHVDRAQQQIR